MNGKLFEIIHEDADLLVINKPAGLACHPTKGDAYSSLISRVRLHVGTEIHPQLINRLDRETSGVTLVAKNASAALALRRAWEKREVQKVYLAIVHGHVLEDGVIDAPLGRDEASAIAIKDKVRDDGAASVTGYRVLSRFERAEGAFSLLEVQPLTGRKHQIRIHLGHIGHPIVGDKMYGLDEGMYLDFVKCRLTDEQRRKLILPHQALHASSLTVESRTFRAEPEPWFTSFLPSSTVLL
ncbi:MAG TPA: RluA family pseudouridine synthase [Candidatus Binatia bacterium]|nr:RluA family pseudouridine synthase [Candidatus Binatia bacterium]